MFIRRPAEADVGDEAVPEREALAGQFGLVPHWAKDEKFGRRAFMRTVRQLPPCRASGMPGASVTVASFRQKRFTSLTGAAAKLYRHASRALMASLWE